MTVDIQHTIAALDVAQWNALAGDDTPFLRHEFLSALERHHAVGGASGWRPHYLTVRQGAQLLGALPMFLKDHSFGEFVFDWAWASVHERHGLPYYPKLVVAVPYTPVTGRRILVTAAAEPAGIADVLIDGALAHARSLGVSSLHFLFTTATDSARLQQNGLMSRHGCQFHWENRGYRDFADFLAALTSRHRKELRRERRLITGQGIDVEVVGGDSATVEDWDAMHRFYLSTFERKGNHAPLSRGFFADIAATLGRQIVLIIARHAGRAVAGALFFRGLDTFYGRHWGCDGEYRHLHFELCYYRAIEYCIEQGLRRFEAGAQGEYKVRRGFEPTLTRSAHWVADPRFAAAIADFLDRERPAVASYIDGMRAHLPFREAS